MRYRKAMTSMALTSLSDTPALLKTSFLLTMLLTMLLMRSVEMNELEGGGGYSRPTKRLYPNFPSHQLPPYPRYPRSTRQSPSAPRSSCGTLRMWLCGCLIVLVTTVVVTVVGVVFYNNVVYEDTSKPCDEGSYLDKAYEFHMRGLNFYNYYLKLWILGKTGIKTSTPPGNAAESLFSIVGQQEAFQKTFSESDRSDYRTQLATARLHYAQHRNGSVWKEAQRYIKSISMDRTVFLEKFLASFIAYPDDNSEAKLNASLLNFDSEIDTLKENLIDYDQEIETYWNDLRSQTTPGIVSSCLKTTQDSTKILSEYKKAIHYRSVQCVPNGERKPEDGRLIIIMYGLLIVLIELLVLRCTLPRCFK